MHSRISHEYMMSKSVGSAVYSRSRNFPVPACMHYPYSSDATVCNQYLMNFSVHNKYIFIRLPVILT